VTEVAPNQQVNIYFSMERGLRFMIRDNIIFLPSMVSPGSLYMLGTRTDFSII
jgi:hypothetical protein